MATGSGKNQKDTKTKESVDLLREREEFNAAAAAAAPPPLAPQSEIEEVDGPPEAGDRDPCAAPPPLAPQSEMEEVDGPPEAGDRDPSAAAEREGEETMSLFGRGSAGGKLPLPPRPSPVSGARGPSSVGGKPPLPPRPPHPPCRMSYEEVLASGMAVRDKWKSDRENRVDLKDVFDQLMLESLRERSEETDQKAEAEGMPRQQNEQEKSLEVWPKKDKKPLWRKKIHITELIRHYNLLEMVAGQGVLFHSHALNLRRAYSEIRPVHGDGECFYRSFIFSNFEQVLDRQDTHEEHRLLAAVKGVAKQHARLGWASEVSRSHKAFKKLIKKVMRWKTHRRWKHIPTINSYLIEKLLEFFSNYERTDDIFTFLRLVAAIWICSHSEEFVPLIPELNEAGYNLTEWYFEEVIQRKVFTDHIQITALVRALRVPLRVEYLFQEAGQDLCIGEEVPRRMSYEEVLASGMAVRDKWKSDRENRVDLKDVFDQLMLECQRERSGETDQKAKAEGMPRQQNEQVKSPEVWPKKDNKLLWRKAILPATMVSGLGKNQEGTETKELADLRSEEMSNSAASTTEPSPAAPPFKSLQEQCDGPLEAGGRDSSAATVAGAEWKGEVTMALSRRGSTGGRDELMLETVMNSEIDQKADLEEMPGQLKEQNILPPQKRDEGTACGVSTAGRRGRKICHRRIFLIAILILFGYLPTVTGFQTNDPYGIANVLREPRYQLQIQEYLVQIQQAQEAQEAARLKVLWRTAAVVLFLAFLFGNLMAGANNGQEEPMPLEAPAPEIGRGPGMLIAVLILFALIIITVAIRAALRGQL